MEENKDIKEAKEELDKISQDDLLRRRALKADLMKRDYAQGLDDAKEAGIKIAKIEMAKKMLEENIDLEVIEKITGLTKEEINNL